MQNHFEFAVENEIVHVQERFADIEQTLRGMQSLVATNDSFNRMAIREYFASLRLDTDLSRIQAIAIIEWIPATSKRTHAAAVPQAGMPGDDARIESASDGSAPIVQREPYTDEYNAVLIGFDTWSDPVRRHALERARDTGEAAITGTLKRKMYADAQGRPGFVMYLPLYARGRPHKTVAERRANLIGWTSAGFLMSKLVATQYGKDEPGIRVSVYDGVAPDESNQLYDSAEKEVLDAILATSEYIDVGGHTWTVNITADNEFNKRFSHDASTPIAAIGIALSVLLALLAEILATGRNRALRLATQMAERLREGQQRELQSLERQRLMEDMHDGFGSSLVAALSAVEHGNLDDNDLAQLLRDCIDDLRLTLDSLDPLDADLLLLLGTLRYRLEPRLESAGIKLQWEVANVPALDWLDPRSALQILRIVQETFANIIKHANATETSLSVRTEGGSVAITVTDNGCGFDVESALARGGRGLSNQQHRAATIAAEIQWLTRPSGTSMKLLLPVKRVRPRNSRAMAVEQS